MPNTKFNNRRRMPSIQNIANRNTDAIAADLLCRYMEHKQAADRHGFLYLMSLTHNVLLKDQRELGCTHSEMMSRLLPWLEPSVVRALPAIFEQELSCARRSQVAA